MTSDAKTVAEYLKSLPEDRRAGISAVRATIRKHLPKGFAEQMQYGMICYVVPHKLYPAGYHCDPSKPLTVAGLASQKNNMSLYLMTPYLNPEVAAKLRDEIASRGKKLDMGKGCIRFKKVEDLPLDVIGEVIASVGVAEYVAQYEAKKPKSAKRASKKGTT